MLKDAVEEWERRSGIGLALGQLAQLVESKEAVQLIHIVVPKGLNDRKAVCRESMCSAAVETIKRHGSTIMGDIMPFLGIFLFYFSTKTFFQKIYLIPLLLELNMTI